MSHQTNCAVRVQTTTSPRWERRYINDCSGPSPDHCITSGNKTRRQDTNHHWNKSRFFETARHELQIRILMDLWRTHMLWSPFVPVCSVRVFSRTLPHRFRYFVRLTLRFWVLCVSPTQSSWQTCACSRRSVSCASDARRVNVPTRPWHIKWPQMSILFRITGKKWIYKARLLFSEFTTLNWIMCDLVGDSASKWQSDGKISKCLAHQHWLHENIATSSKDSNRWLVKRFRNSHRQEIDITHRSRGYDVSKRSLITRIYIYIYIYGS